MIKNINNIPKSNLIARADTNFCARWPLFKGEASAPDTVSLLNCPGKKLGALKQIKKFFKTTYKNIKKFGKKTYKKIKKFFKNLISRLKNLLLTTEDKRIDNFHTVGGKLLRGAQPDTEKAMQALHEKGVKTIIDLRSTKTLPPEIMRQEIEMAARHGITHVNIPMHANKKITEANIREFFKAINKTDGIVYVHCKQGIDRTGITTALYEMKKFGKTPEQAFENMKKFGYNWYHKIKFKAQMDYLLNDRDKWQPILDKVTVN